VLFDEVPRMTWQRKQTITISAARITAVSGVPGENYNPFDHERLYLEFLSLDENNPNLIVDFIRSYGFLGVSQCGAKEPYEESLVDIAHQIARMKSITSLRNAIETEDLTQITNACDNFIVRNNTSPGSPATYHLDALHDNALPPFSNEPLSEGDYQKETYLDPCVSGLCPEESPLLIQWIMLAKAMIANEMNKELKNITPVLDWRGEKDKFVGSWTSIRLLSAMYAMFYMDLIQGSKIRKCRNETCSKYFVVYGDDDRKAYCNHSCASTQSQREYRRREKEKKNK